MHLLPKILKVPSVLVNEVSVAALPFLHVLHTLLMLSNLLTNFFGIGDFVIFLYAELRCVNGDTRIHLRLMHVHIVKSVLKILRQIVDTQNVSKGSH